MVQTADRVLTVAARLFRAKGYEGTSTREIAKLAGIEKASLYHHIGAKEDLLYTLCDESLNRLLSGVERVLATEKDPRLRLQQAIHAHVLAVLADLDTHTTMLRELRGLTGARRAHVLARRKEYELMLREIVSDSQNSSVLRTDIDVKMLTLVLLNMLNWTIFWFKPDGTLSASQLADLLTRMYLEGAVASS